MPRTTVLLIATVLLMYAGTAWVASWRWRDEYRPGLRRTGFHIAVNQADPQTLCLLPGIGPNLATRIVEHRRQHGPFGSIEQLRQVKGIGAKKQARLAPLISVSPDPQRHTRSDQP